MNPLTGGKSSSRRLYFLLANYLVILVLSVFLSVQLIDRITSGHFEGARIYIPIAMILPVVLIVALVINLIRIAREGRRGEPGYRLKRRLISLFALVTILSTVPQAALSGYTIIKAYTAWFSPDIGSALNSGLYFSLIYYHDLIGNLKLIGRSRFLEQAVDQNRDNPVRVWEQLTSVNPWIHTLQIYSEGKSDIFGDTLCELTPGEILAREEGMLPRIKRQEISILSNLTVMTLRGTEYRIVISTILPKDFDAEAENLTRATEQYRNFYTLLPFIKLSAGLLFVVFTAPLIFLSLLLGIVFTDRIITPVSRLARAARRIEAGDYTFRLVPEKNDDFNFFIDSFNAMVREIQNSRTSLMQTERVSTWQGIAQRLTHELRNPLTPIKLTAQRLQRKLDGLPEGNRVLVGESLQLILAQVDHMDRMLQDFRSFADDREPVFQKRNLVLFLQDQILLQESRFPGLKTDIRIPDSPVIVPMDPEQLSRALENMARNSHEASPEGVTVSIDVDIIDKGALPYARICFRDNGPGIPAEAIERIFEPYFTTRDNGLGLGLAVTERIISQHRGRIWAESEPGTGTVFFIDLPLEG
jgi:nitrogen fixation/metabolism regulation signal transduction histidine kinase